MPDNFTIASTSVRRCARRLMKAGTPTVVVADSLICQALAAWGAETGRAEDASGMLAIWAVVRDAG